MLMWMFRLVSALMNAALVNWGPWSMFTIAVDRYKKMEKWSEQKKAYVLFPRQPSCSNPH